MKRYPGGRKVLALAEQQTEDRGEWILTFLRQCFEDWYSGRLRFEAAVGEINYLSAKAGGLVLGLDDETGKLNVFLPATFYAEADKRPHTRPESLFSLTPHHGTPAREATKGKDEFSLSWRAAQRVYLILGNIDDAMHHPENWPTMGSEELRTAGILFLCARLVGCEYCKIERRGRRASLVVDENRWRGGAYLGWHERDKRHKESRLVSPPA
jgi:hypothetical protein